MSSDLQLLDLADDEEPLEELTAVPEPASRFAALLLLSFLGFARPRRGSFAASSPTGAL